MLQEVVLGKDIKLFVKVGGIYFPISTKIFGFDGIWVLCIEDLLIVDSWTS